jgi:hypothetical protein
MKKLDNFSFTSISEYSPTPEVSRARGAFFAGKKSFLLITERFHFFRRYVHLPRFFPAFLSTATRSRTGTNWHPIGTTIGIEFEEPKLSFSTLPQTTLPTTLKFFHPLSTTQIIKE